MIKKSIALLAVLFLMISVSAVVQAETDKPLVPDFTLTSSDGAEISLSDYQGKVVVLNFWASWCPHCRAEMSDLQALHDQFSEEEDVVLLLINQIDGRRQETVETSKKFLEQNDFTMTNLYDYGQVGGRIFGIPGLPTTVVIDREGYMSSYVVGGVNVDIVLEMVEGAE